MESVFLETYRRQADMIVGLAGFITEENRKFRIAANEWPLDFHAAHVHETRHWWLSKVDPERAKALPSAVVQVGEKWQALDDLEEIRRLLGLSAEAVIAAAEEALKAGAVAQYEHPAFFVQHMVWHEGYHYGIMNTLLRLSDSAPSEEWEEENVWVKWRGVEEWE